MVTLSFFEDIKDKASLILPTVYLPIVEECTAPHLEVPTREHVIFLQEKARAVPDDLGEILRALRRRMHDENARIRMLTLKLIDLLIRNGTPAFHNELAGNKGLLREIEETATSTLHTGPWNLARQEARTLILNVNGWFQGNPNPNTHIFTTLVTDVKQTSGPSSFVGITPDLTVRLQLPGESSRHRRSTPHSRVTDPPRRTAAAPPSSTSKGGAASNVSRRKSNIVDAIPVNLPTESSISAMLDTCATLAEYLSNAETDPVSGAFQKDDDVLISFQRKVQEDHSYLALLLSSDLDVDREVIRSLLDSQAAILQQVKDGRPVAPSSTAAGWSSSSGALEAARKSDGSVAVGSRTYPSPAGAGGEQPSAVGGSEVHHDPFGAVPGPANIYRPRTAASADVEDNIPVSLMASVAPSSDSALPAVPEETSSASPPSITLENLFMDQSEKSDAAVEVPPPITTGTEEAAEPTAPEEEIPAVIDTDTRASEPVPEPEDDFDDFLDKELGG